MVSEIALKGQNMTAQGKDEVRHPGYAITSKILSALKGRHKMCQANFVCDPYRVVKIWGQR